jgi:hypothetical protein
VLTSRNVRQVGRKQRCGLEHTFDRATPGDSLNVGDIRADARMQHSARCRPCCPPRPLLLCA